MSSSRNMRGRFVLGDSGSRDIDILALATSWIKERDRVEVKEKVAHSRLGIILYVDGVHQIYLFDLGVDVGVSTTSTTVRPNLCIPRGLGVLRFCCVGSTLYVFQVTSDWKKTRSGGVDKEQVFKIDLTPRVSSLSDHILNVEEDYEGMLERVTNSLSPKASGIPLQWDRNIVLFSSQIVFQDCLMNTQVKDFEIYCPVKNECIALPPLLVRPESRLGSIRFRDFQFFDGHSSRWKNFPISPPQSYSVHSYFTIHSYGLRGSKLLIQADFGTAFCLELHDGCDAKWELLGDGVFTSKGQIFIDDQLGLGVEACGIIDMSAYPCTGTRSYIEYPFLSAPSTDRGFTLLNIPGKLPRIIRFGLNTPPAEVEYDVAGELCWCIETLSLEESEDGVGVMNLNFKLPVSSREFCLKDQHVLRAGIVDLFPCYY